MTTARLLTDVCKICFPNVPGFEIVSARSHGPGTGIESFLERVPV